MGGCYDTSYSYRAAEPTWKSTTDASLKKFFKSKDVADLVNAYKSFSDENKSGFIKAVIEHAGLQEAPKEFPEIEYEVKFALRPKGRGKEPGVEQYLDAFEFPATRRARFLKDEVNAIAEGENHFFGSGLEERLVVINKGGGLYLKEKSQPLELNTGAKHEEIVIKRTESRYAASMEKVLKRVIEETKNNVDYKGWILKEKGDAFVLDTKNGRIFSFTVTRAHDDERIQRQLEIEYAGYVPGFPDFEEDNERQIVESMVDMARHVMVVSNGTQIVPGWNLELEVTSERKYDFISQLQEQHTLALPLEQPIKVRKR